MEARREAFCHANALATMVALDTLLNAIEQELDRSARSRAPVFRPRMTASLRQLSLGRSKSTSGNYLDDVLRSISDKRVAWLHGQASPRCDQRDGRLRTQ
jgi:hypothetical protein